MTGLEAHHRWVGRGRGRLGGWDYIVVSGGGVPVIG